MKINLNFKHPSYFIFLILLLIGQCSSLPKKGDIEQPKTKDGFKLTVEYFKALPNTQKKNLPVLILHGFMSNRNEFKIGNQASIVHELQANGYDVYISDLRGRSDASDTSFFFGARTYNYSIDDYAKQDLDTTLTYILNKSGKKKVHFLAHSMGGLIAYMAIGSFNEKRIANLVTIASPGIMTPADRYLSIGNRMQDALSALPVLPLAGFADFAAFMRLKPIPSQLSLYIWHRDNITRETELEFMRHGAANISKHVIYQMTYAQRNRDFVSTDKKINYSKNLINIKQPALLIAARRDNIVTPANVRYVYDHISSSDKTYKIISASKGYITDYGHTDLLVGLKAKDEVFPIITKWLNKHDK